MAECTCADPSLVSKAIEQQTSKIEEKADEIHKTLYGAENSDTGGGKGTPGKIDRIRFCHWAAPEWGPDGESAWVNAFQAAQLAISILNATIQGEIADKQQDLADGYYQQAKFKWDRFADKYMPLEKDILWEASSEPIRELDCEDDTTRAYTAVNTAFNTADKSMGTLAKQYRLCLDDTVIRQMEFTKSRLDVDTINYNLRDDQWFVDFKNDQRWNRRSNILNLGRNLGAVAMQYGDVARQLMNNVSNQANKAFGTLSQALGYYGSRFDTHYPTTYLAGNMTQLVNTSTSPGSGFSATGSTWGI